MTSPRTLPEKVWERHLVRSAPGEPDLLYIDLHLVHEVTSPQAFDGLRLAGRKVRRPELTIATVDHNVPTEDQFHIREPMSRRQGGGGGAGRPERPPGRAHHTAPTEHQSHTGEPMSRRQVETLRNNCKEFG